MHRRAFVKGAGAVVVMAAGRLVWRAHDQGVFASESGPAFEPWRTWHGDSAEGPLALVRAAILAANPHNTQPWLFRLDGARVELYADAVRNLGAFDPYLREMHIGLGCAVENMARAAGALGYKATVTLAPGALEPAPATPLLSPPRAAPPRAAAVATLDLSPARARPDALFEAIPRRHTNRGPYEASRPVPPEAIAAMWVAFQDDADVRLFLFSAPEERRRFSAAVVAATEAIVADRQMVDDSQRWFRHRRADVERLRDGPTLDAAGLSPLMTAMAKMLPPSSPETSHRYWLDATRDVHVATSPLFGLIAVRDLYDRPQALRAGRRWQRLHLLATTQGLAMQPINQPVELVDRERQQQRSPAAARVLAELTGDPTWLATFAFRAGFAARGAPPSPRRAVDAVVLRS